MTWIYFKWINVYFTQFIRYENAFIVIVKAFAYAPTLSYYFILKKFIKYLNWEYWTIYVLNINFSSSLSNIFPWAAVGQLLNCTGYFFILKKFLLKKFKSLHLTLTNNKKSIINKIKPTKMNWSFWPKWKKSSNVNINVFSFPLMPLFIIMKISNHNKIRKILTKIKTIW